MHSEGDFGSRKAPYAPISALREFFSRMRDVSVPQRVDRRFIQKQNIASNNEWALLSALKFLGVIDERGAPTHAYRLLQSTDQFEDTLRHLVETAYAPLFDSGGARMSADDLENYFRVTSSPSQAKNAARFFREVCSLAGIDLDTGPQGRVHPLAAASPRQTTPGEPSGLEALAQPPNTSDLLAAKARLLEKLPTCRDEWTAAEYEAICEQFVTMLRSLDVPPTS